MGPAVISQWEVGTDRNMGGGSERGPFWRASGGAGPPPLRAPSPLPPPPRGLSGRVLTGTLIPATSGGPCPGLLHIRAGARTGGILFSGFILFNVQVDTTNPPSLLLHTLSWFSFLSFLSFLLFLLSTLPSIWDGWRACIQGSARNTVKGVLHWRALERPLGACFLSEDAASLKGRCKEWVFGGTLVLLEILLPEN